MNMVQPAVIVENLRKSYLLGWRGPYVQALKGVSFQIEQGEVFGLLGPNGSGKSTTLKILLGLIQPDGGRALVYGKTGNHREIRQRIGYLPEGPYFYRYLSAVELVQFFAQLSGIPAKQIKPRVEEVLQLVGLAGLAKQPVGTFSKGMLQRVGLAQAIVHDPDLVILDEPTAGMDPEGVMAVENMIREIKALGKTIILCSHQLSQVESLCDRIAILHKGNLVCSGALDSLLKHGDEVLVRVSACTPEMEGELHQVVARYEQKIIEVKEFRDSLDEVYLRELFATQDSGDKPTKPPAIEEA